MKHWALIAASGTSARMGQIDKLFAPLHQQPVLLYSLRLFLDHPDFAGVVLSLPHNAEAWDALRFSHKKLRICGGGSSRQTSVWHGLQCITTFTRDNPLVFVQDGARPTLSTNALNRCIFEAQSTDTPLIVGRRATDSIKRTAPGDNTIVEHCKRNHFWQAQTPQIARLQILMQAYERCIKQQILVTDEATALSHFDHTIRMFDCEEPNIKITHPQDLLIAEQLVSPPQNN